MGAEPETGGTVRLQLRLELGSGPVIGQLEDEGGAAEPFHGWLALAGLIEAARTPPRDGEPPRPTS
jgi:hypothetical protein